jgi:Tol biopolymer transport system component
MHALHRFGIRLRRRRSSSGRVRVTGAVAVVTLAVLGSVLTLATPRDASATFGGANGRIYFLGRPTSSSNGDQIWSLNPDGNDLRAVTDQGNVSYIYALPSPDGRRLATSRSVRSPDGTAVNEVVVMNTDGTNSQNVAGHAGAVYYATSWSPDGQKLLATKVDATSGRDLGIVVLGLDQSEQTVIPPATTTDPTCSCQVPAHYLTAVWSADGNRVAFTTDAGGLSRHFDIFVASPDGSHGSQLTHLGDVDEFDLSPDGSKIVFNRDQGYCGCFHKIWFMNSDSSGQTQLTPGACCPGPGASYPDNADQLDPQFSPDGSKIIYWSQQPLGNANLFVMNVDGSSVTQLTHIYDPYAFSAPRAVTGRWSVAPTDVLPPATTDDAPAGWWNRDVTVHLTPKDASSGVAATYYQIDGGPILSGNDVSISAPVDHSNDGAHTISYYSVDKAGNVETTHEVVVAIDTTAPIVSGTPDRQANAAGWYNGPVTITWAATDPVPSSGPPTTPPATTISTDGAGQLVTSAPSCDGAGNCATGSLRVWVDAVPPAVSVIGPAAEATYPVGTAPSPSCATFDATSGTAADAELSITGMNSDGSGVITATCAGAVDNAGNNAAPVAVTYQIYYAVTDGGFSGSVDSPPLINTGKAGRTYQFAFQLTRADGTIVSDTSVVVSLTYTVVSCATFDGAPADALVADTSGKSGLHFDTTSQRFIYNWKTPYTAGCYLFFVRLRDGNVLRADFELT